MFDENACTATERFNSQPPEGGWQTNKLSWSSPKKFQLTAARRRLGGLIDGQQQGGESFNSQPPEGGWLCMTRVIAAPAPFQLTAARRRLEENGGSRVYNQMFQLTAARRRLVAGV